MIKIGRFLQLLALIFIAAGAQPVASAVYQWSTTAANNATADPSINFSEGMSPSAVNDSARALMQQIQFWRKDTTGSNLQTAGGPVAYTLTSNEGFTSTAVMVGAVFNFYSISSNAAGATLNVDGLGAFPIQTSTGVAVPAGALVAGGHYTITFSNTASAFILENYYASSFNIPLGGILWSTVSTAPNANFVAPSGQCISTTTYAAYWVAMGSPASGACAGGQFAIIDMRGKVAAALDTLNASAAGLMTNSATGCGTAFTTVGAVCANGNQSQSLSAANVPPITSTNPAQTITVASTTANTATGTIQSANVTGGADKVFTSNGANVVINSSGSNSISVTSTGTSGTAFPRVMPTIGLIPYLRIL